MVEWVDLLALLQARDLKLAGYKAVNRYHFQIMVVKIQFDPVLYSVPKGSGPSTTTAPATQGFCLFIYTRSAVRLFGCKANENCGL